MDGQTSGSSLSISSTAPADDDEELQYVVPGYGGGHEGCTVPLEGTAATTLVDRGKTKTRFVVVVLVVLGSGC